MLFNKFNIKSNNINILAFTHFIFGLIFFIPILALYLEGIVGSVTNVAIIFATHSIAVILLEVPTGAIADLFGRRISYLLGGVIAVIAFLFLAFGLSMFAFITYALLMALGSALMSGSDDAIIYDTLKAEKKEHHYKQIISLLRAIWPLSAIVGALIGGYIATISLALTIQLSLLPIGIGVFISFFIKEPKFKKEKHKNIVKQVKQSTSFVFGNKQLLVLTLIALFMMAFGETAHNLKPLFLAFKNISLEIFGIVFALTFALSSLGHYFSHHISEKIGNKKTIVLAATGFPICILIAAFTEGFISIFFLVLTGFLFGLRGPVHSHLLNLEASSSKRATIVSVNNLMIHVGLALGGVLLGKVADVWTINVAYIVAGCALFSALVTALFLEDKK
jgi:MFS family permease